MFIETFKKTFVVKNLGCPLKIKSYWGCTLGMKISYLLPKYSRIDCV